MNKLKEHVLQIEDGIIKGDLAYKINQFEEAHPEIDLGWFNDLIRDVITSKSNQANAYNAQKPEVTEAWLWKAQAYIAEYPSYHRLEEKLKEAGVEVVEK